jgi:pyruvate dehydrogenase E1 component beta subunit
MATAAAEALENEEISAEVLDLRSIKPLDLEAILQSVSKTHRVVIVEQDRPFCGRRSGDLLSNSERNI